VTTRPRVLREIEMAGRRLVTGHGVQPRDALVEKFIVEVRPYCLDLAGEIERLHAENEALREDRVAKSRVSQAVGKVIVSTVASLILALVVSGLLWGVVTIWGAIFR